MTLHWQLTHRLSRKGITRAETYPSKGRNFNIGIPVFDDSIYKLVSRIPITRLRNKMIRNLGWMDPPHHVTIWSTGTIEKALEDLGFSVIWKAYRSDVLPWIRNFRCRYIYFRLIGIPLKFLGSGASIEILAKNIG